MCVTVCGKFVPDEGVVAGYDNRIRDKFPAKWGVQIAGMIFQTGSRTKWNRKNTLFVTINVQEILHCDMFGKFINFLLGTEETFKLTFSQLWHIIIAAKECGEIPFGETKAPRVATSGGFLARHGELIRLGCRCLSFTVQPFAYVVANHTC